MKILKKNFDKNFFAWQKMAALNQERFTLATDDTMKELRNGAKKYQHHQKYVILVKCVEPVMWRKKHKFGNQGTWARWIQEVTWEIDRKSVV